MRQVIIDGVEYIPKKQIKSLLADAKIGDWAKYDIDSYLRVIETPGRERTLCKTLSGVIVYPYTSCLTKVSPSEVVIRIGCLSGTVTYAISDDCFLLAKVYDPQHRACCIDMSMLDTATRELVESLLKAQEEQRRPSTSTSTRVISK